MKFDQTGSVPHSGWREAVRAYDQRRGVAWVVAHTVVPVLLLAACARGDSDRSRDAGGVPSPPSAAEVPDSPGCRVAPGAGDHGDPLLLSADSMLNCEVVFEETGTVLRGDSVRGWPSPGNSSARDSKGRFYSSVAADNSTVAMWAADGSFIRTFAGPGQGPGEIPPAFLPPTLYVDSRDYLFVRTSGNTWTAFDSTQTFRFRLRAQGDGEMIMANGQLLSGRGLPRSAHIFTMTDSVGARRSFGDLPPEVPLKSSATVFRGTAKVSDSLFWAGPVTRYRQGYTLELWSVVGKRLATIQRDAPWFVETADPAREQPTIRPKNVDADGNVLVYVWVPNSTWRPVTDREEARRLTGSMQDIHMEVVSPAGGRVLGTKAVSLSALLDGTVPGGFFPGTRMGFRVVEDSLGYRTIHIVRYVLKHR